MLLLLSLCSVLFIANTDALVIPKQRSGRFSRTFVLSAQQRQNRKQEWKRNTNKGNNKRNPRSGYEIRKTDDINAIVKKKNRRRTPRWETEGDSLYRLIQERYDKDDDKSSVVGDNQDEFEIAKKLLEKMKTIESSIHTIDVVRNQSQEEQRGPSQPNTVMWGSCSVGPILRSRLVPDLPNPTPIQEAAFPLIANKKKRPNVVIASPTGSGKTLAYLVPLVSVLQRNIPGQLIIIAPTIDLAYQIKKEVNRLWPPAKKAGGQSSLHVVDPKCVNENEEGENMTSLLSLAVAGNPTILAGTPKSIRQLFTEMKRNKQMARPLQVNLRTVVLDEADRLLRTEGVARDKNEKEEMKTRKGNRNGKKKSSSPTELLLRELPIDYYIEGRTQIVCASATVGRTLRRQIMELVGAPSIDKASVLVTDVFRNMKDATKRKATVLPSSIHHAYALRENIDGKGDDSTTAVALWDTMKLLPPAPALVLPGKASVPSLVDFFRSTCQLNDVRTLREQTDAYSEDRPKPTSKSNSWNDTTVFVVGEKFTRGLDIEGGVDYVFLSSPPSSPAAYTHLAGRTGRGGRTGNAITLVGGIMEAKRVLALSETLGVSFTDINKLLKHVNQEDVINESQVEPGCATKNEDHSAPQLNHPFAGLSKSALSRKKVVDLADYLEKQGVSTTDKSGKTMLKADLVSLVVEALNRS